MNAATLPPQPPRARRGLMLVLSSPSGAGKSTLTRQLVQDDPAIRLSVSVTTRAQRPSEIDGKHYHFITADMFHAMKERGELLESAEVHGHFYGTPKKAVEQALASGWDVLFDIDWQGTEQIVAAMRADVATIFVLPPSMDELRSRLERRAEDSAEVIARADAAPETAAQLGLSVDAVKSRLHRARTLLREQLLASGYWSA